MICKLCGANLIEVDDSDIGLKWECPTKIKDRPDFGVEAEEFSHFLIKNDGCISIYTEDYRVIEIKYLSDGTEFYIYQWSDQYAAGWRWFGSAPPFNFSSEEQLLKRIKTILVFS